MIRKKLLINKLKKALIGSFFVFLGLFGCLSVTTLNSEPVYAVEGDNVATVGTDSCKDSLGALGWLVCPTTGKISEAVDWLYDKIETYLEVSPTPANDGSPIYEVWKYVKGVTNVVFIVFLLVVIYSQITGLGINNYGIKKALPKLIVAAVLVNLSFLICQLAVDASNIVGSGLRGVFSSVAEAAVPASAGGASHVSYAEMYTALAGGTALTIGAGVVALETGAIWMLIPTALGALVAALSGLITIALRQAVVALLIMIAPLAMVANILPNTEQWFKKWKDLLFKMLIFYPMFSLLFGASQLAGFAIIASAKDGFGILLGTAVQIFPLFFSWSLMKMSGTFLGGINAKLNSLAAGPLAANRAWADSHRQLAKSSYLASGRASTPSLRLMQFVNKRKIAREEEISEKQAAIKERGLAHRARQNYRRGNLDGVLSRKGEEAYELQAQVMEYQKDTARNKNNFNKGFSERVRKGTSRFERLDALDTRNMNAADNLKFEAARGAMIDYRNAEAFQKRVTNAINAHFDQKAIDEGNLKHKSHGALSEPENIERYERIKNIMEGKEIDVHFAAMDAASTFNAQAQIVRNKFQTYTDLTPATQDVVTRLKELTSMKDSSDYIDPIIAGLRTLNMRGDTDLVRAQVENILNDDKMKLGTYASQALANFCMFEVKGGDPFLRRFGKFINLETAAMFNEPDDIKDLEKRRKKDSISMSEYINGEYEYVDHYTEDGIPVIEKKKVKRDAATLLNGTSFKDIERTAIKNMTEAIRKHSVDENGNFDMTKFMENEKRIWNAIMPNIIGDQFSFLSGSEQIIALGKGLTGIDVGKRQFDWNGIFGDDIAKTLTPEQKKAYIEFMNERAKGFLGGHVPVQIARTKTDMLEAIKTQYTLADAILNGEGSLENRFNELESKGYDTIYGERKDNVKKMFVDSFKEDALKGFAKMYQKGYQGEAKAGLIELLRDELDRQVYKDAKEQRERKRKFDEEEEGMPVRDEEDDLSFGGGEIYNEGRLEVEKIYKRYRRSSDARSFWEEVKNVIRDPRKMDGRTVSAAEIDEIDRAVVNGSAAYWYGKFIDKFFK